MNRSTVTNKLFGDSGSRTWTLLNCWDKEERALALTDDEIESWALKVMGRKYNAYFHGVCDEAMAPLPVGSMYRMWARHQILDWMAGVKALPVMK